MEKDTSPWFSSSMCSPTDTFELKNVIDDVIARRRRTKGIILNAPPEPKRFKFVKPEERHVPPIDWSKSSDQNEYLQRQLSRALSMANAASVENRTLRRVRPTQSCPSLPQDVKKKLYNYDDVRTKKKEKKVDTGFNAIAASLRQRFKHSCPFNGVPFCFDWEKTTCSFAFRLMRKRRTGYVRRRFTTTLRRALSRLAKRQS